MGKQIAIFKKNKIDFDAPNVITIASEGNAYSSYVRLRNNNIGWITTGSVDANNTTFEVDIADSKILTDIILVLHNFKSYTLKYWNGSSYVDFSPAISVSGNTATTTRHSFASVTPSKVLLTITGTQVADSDKRLAQFICTEIIGQLNGWPVIENPIQDLNKRTNQMLSGKTYIAENIGAFSCDLSVSIWRDSADLTVVETMYGSSDGFLVWLCGGDQTQFSSVRQGYRLQDIFLMKCSNNLQPEWANGLYQSGFSITVSLTEVTR